MTFCTLYADDLQDDILSKNKWEQLEKIKKILKPFEEVTKHLEGTAIHGHHGSIWEALPAVELLLQHLEKMKQEYRDQSLLSTSINLAWSKLNKYYQLMDKVPVYAAALFLHPSYRFNYFKKHWTTPTLRAYQSTTLAAIRKLYKNEYQQNLTTDAIQELNEETQQEKDILFAYLNADEQLKDEFDTYLEGSTVPLSANANIYAWWANSGFTQLAAMAFDILSIPAMSAEAERVFSGTKLTISSSRNRLGDDIIEATECLNHWYKHGL